MASRLRLSSMLALSLSQLAAIFAGASIAKRFTFAETAVYPGEFLLSNLHISECVAPIPAFVVPGSGGHAEVLSTIYMYRLVSTWYREFHLGAKKGKRNRTKSCVTPRSVLTASWKKQMWKLCMIFRKPMFMFCSVSDCVCSAVTSCGSVSRIFRENSTLHMDCSIWPHFAGSAPLCGVPRKMMP